MIFTNAFYRHTHTYVEANVQVRWYTCMLRWNEMKSWLPLSTGAELNYEIRYVAGQQQQQQLTVGVQPVPPRKTAICIGGSHRCCWKCSCGTHTSNFPIILRSMSLYRTPFYAKIHFPENDFSILQARKKLNNKVHGRFVLLMSNPWVQSGNAEWLHLIGLTRQCAFIRGPINIQCTDPSVKLLT